MQIIAEIILVLAILAGIEIYREVHCFKRTDYAIVSEKLNIPEGKEKKIVFLSDLHNQQYGQNNENLVKAIRESDPDFIWIGGDMLIGKEDSDYAPALSFVKEITGICPVYCASGNHEQRMKENPEDYQYSYVEYKEVLEACGVHFLENETVRFAEYNITLRGLEIPLACYRRFRKGTLTVEEIIERIGQPDETTYEVLLAHNPTYMETYQKWGADLVLSGHLHGGVVRIPGILGVISPAFELFPKYSGDLYRDGDKISVVSKGLGTHTFHIRLWNPAEFIVLHLKTCN